MALRAVVNHVVPWCSIFVTYAHRRCRDLGFFLMSYRWSESFIALFDIFFFVHDFSRFALCAFSTCFSVCIIFYVIYKLQISGLHLDRFLSVFGHQSPVFMIKCHEQCPT